MTETISILSILTMDIISYHILSEIAIYLNYDGMDSRVHDPMNSNNCY